MKPFILPIGAFVIGLSACTTDRVSTEFEALNTLMGTTDTKVQAKLADDLATEQEAAITEAAQAGDLWTLSSDCLASANNSNTAVGVNCSVIKVLNNNRVPTDRPAMTVQRKMAVLKNYVGSLELLMSSTSQEELTAAYASAITSFSSLADATENAELLRFVKKRQNDKEKVEATVSKAIEALRYNRMRSVVRASNEDIRTLTDEVNALLISLDVEGGFADKLDKLRDANKSARSADPANPVAYRAALVGLETEHSEFMTYYKGTTIHAVATLAQVHDALTKAISSNGSAEDIVSYLESLKALSDTIEG